MDPTAVAPSTAEKNRQHRINVIDERIADLQARRAALLSPPFAEGDQVYDIDDEPRVIWTVTGYDPTDPRLVNLTSRPMCAVDVKQRMNWPAEELHHVNDFTVDEQAWRECAFRADYTTAAEHERECTFHRGEVDENGLPIPAEPRVTDVDAAHKQALTEDNFRADSAVIAGLRDGESGRITNPNLARFLAEREQKRRYLNATVALTAEGGNR